jgi:hypothetical protein
MAGRPRIVRCKDSYINNIDNNTASGPMKMGTAPSVGITHNYWHTLQTNCNTTANKPKKSYKNMVFLNINPSQTPVNSGFTQSTNYNYSYIPNNPINIEDYNTKYHNHYYRPYLANQNNQTNQTNLTNLTNQSIINRYNALYEKYLISRYNSI